MNKEREALRKVMRLQQELNDAVEKLRQTSRDLSLARSEALADAVEIQRLRQLLTAHGITY